jgi:hypothetical protein
MAQMQEDSKEITIEIMKVTNRLAEALACIESLGETFKKEKIAWEKFSRF